TGILIRFSCSAGVQALRGGADVNVALHLPANRGIARTSRLAGHCAYHTAMEVRFFPNSRRPGVGLAPRREASRPLLPQHARHCPVLEAGSTLGFMVYAPLEPKESVYVEHEGDGRYKFVYYLKTQEGRPTPIFQVTMSLSIG